MTRTVDAVPFGLEGPVEVIAHRGFSARAPENTRASMEMAIEAAADALELDLHVAGDGTPYVIHDATLERTTDGSGAVRDHDAAYLTTLDAGSWFDPEFAGEPLPTVASVLEGVRGRIGRVYAEIKGYRTLADVDTLVAVTVGAEMLSDTVFISMDWDALDRVRAQYPDALIGYIVESEKRITPALELARDDPRALLDFDRRLLLAAPGRAREARESSIELAAWTVNDVAEAARLLAMGVPRITTNQVEKIHAWKKTL